MEGKALKKTYLALFLTALLTIFLVACGEKNDSEQASADINADKRVVQIGYLPITHAVPLFVEKELAEYENFELELIKFGSWPELMDALNTGRIDGASVLVTLALKAKEQGIDIKAVALGHRDGNVLVVGNEINSVQDLKGKSFAIPHKFSTHNILLYQMLKKIGLEYEDVEAIEVPPAEMPAALSEGRVAGYVVAEPFGAISVALNNGKVLYQDQEIWQDSIDCTLVLRSEFIESEREVAEQFVSNYLKAGEVAELKDEQTHNMSSKYMKVEKDVLDLSFEWISYDDLRIHEKDYNELTKNLIEMGLSERPPTYADFVDNSFIDKAN